MATFIPNLRTREEAAPPTQAFVDTSQLHLFRLSHEFGRAPPADRQHPS